MWLCKKDTLWPFILNYVLPGTNIMSDGLRSYYGLEHAGADYEHGVVEHKYNFVDPETGCDHTQSIESNWNKFKQDRIKSKYGAANLFSHPISMNLSGRRNLKSTECMSCGS
uniref:ISXO2-like transposase domain-containing protein n=1 Tax=Ditylenchus dipsaci TaxID=166011 RepID=A0A915EDT2_9BILA